MVRKIVLIVISIVSILFIYSYYSNKSKEDYFSTMLIEKISLNESSKDTFQIKISELTNFEWDTLFISKPYFNLKTVNDLVNLEWKYFDFQIPYFETGGWFIFKKKDKIIYDFYFDNLVFKNDILKYYIPFQDLKDIYLYDSSNFKLCYDTIITAKIYDVIR